MKQNQENDQAKEEDSATHNEELVFYFDDAKSGEELIMDE